MGVLIVCTVAMLSGCSQSETGEAAAEPASSSAQLNFVPRLSLDAYAKEYSRARLDTLLSTNPDLNFGLWICESNDEAKLEDETAFIPLVDDYKNMWVNYYVTAEKNYSNKYYTNTGKSLSEIAVPHGSSLNIYAYNSFVKQTTDNASTFVNPLSIPITFNEQNEWMYASCKLPADSTLKDKITIPLDFHHVPLTCIELVIKRLNGGAVNTTSICLYDTKSLADETRGKCLYQRGTFDAVHGKMEIDKTSACDSLQLTPGTEVAVPTSAKPSYYSFLIPPIDEVEEGQFKIRFRFNNTWVEEDYVLPLTGIKTTKAVGGTETTEEVKISKFEELKVYQYHLTFDNRMKFTVDGIFVKEFKDADTEEKKYEL